MARKAAPKRFFISFEKIIRQSEKAWLVELKTGKQVWFSKNHCILILNTKSVAIPKWLYEKMEINKDEEV